MSSHNLRSVHEGAPGPGATIAGADLEVLAAVLARTLSPVASRAAAADLISAFGGLAGVAAADESALMRAGLEAVTVADLGQVRALSSAMARAEACLRPVLSSWTALTTYLRADLAYAPREQFRVLYLDRRNILMKDEWRADGTVDHAPVYGSDGRITAVGASFEGLRQPTDPIPAHITAITGIDDAMVAGQSIDPEEVVRFAEQADLVIAPNAAFDRRFLERFCPVFAAKPWACSMSQIDWGEEGHEGVKLAYLGMGAAFFYDGHRAVHDCAAGIALLASRLPRSGDRALARLLERARAPTWRIWAEGAPFDLKNVLKARGYRWNGDGLGGPKAWFTDVSEADKAAELDFLARDIGLGDREPLVRRVDAYDRFSERC